MGRGSARFLVVRKQFVTALQFHHTEAARPGKEVCVLCLWLHAKSHRPVAPPNWPTGALNTLIFRAVVVVAVAVVVLASLLLHRRVTLSSSQGQAVRAIGADRSPLLLLLLLLLCS
ncbi:unnamed protein product [Polarella glacialis]|uniref:Uncharacterized protein n=1 Tax=Polarella glacialis TaxID=89957 RepID=A0A813JII8_POLGL|nr:unnamed protein product [Polarella glacialis]